MQRQVNLMSQRTNRIQLIARVQIAYEEMREAMQRYRDRAPHARAAVASAKRRLSLLNRALAMLALEASSSAA